MKSKRHNTIVWSAALAGILGWLAPDAHGHGNNPRDIESSGSIWGYPQSQPGLGAPIFLHLSNDDGPQQASTDDVTPIDLGPFLDGGPGLPDLGTMPLQDPLSLPPMVIISAPMEPAITLPGDFVAEGNVLDTMTAPAIGVPSGLNLIPAPGTLALVGLAALAARRRRRRS